MKILLLKIENVIKKDTLCYIRNQRGCGARKGGIITHLQDVTETHSPPQKKHREDKKRTPGVTGGLKCLIGDFCIHSRSWFRQPLGTTLQVGEKLQIVWQLCDEAVSNCQLVAFSVWSRKDQWQGKHWLLLLKNTLPISTPRPQMREALTAASCRCREHHRTATHISFIFLPQVSLNKSWTEGSTGQHCPNSLHSSSGSNAQ